MVRVWVAEIELCGFEKGEVEEGEDGEFVGEPLGGWEAWDDVHGGVSPIEEVKKARHEEVTYMKRRAIWDLRPIEECWEKTGKARYRLDG